MKEDELKYDEPPVLIGTGSFGQVIIGLIYTQGSRVFFCVLRENFKGLLIRAAEACILVVVRRLLHCIEKAK